MKIIIIGKRNQMGTMPVINLKGMSRLLYKFEWDKGIQAYAYEPANQRQADDIFATQNKLYKTMRFSVHLGDEEAGGNGHMTPEDMDTICNEDFEDVDDKKDLLARCKGLELDVIPQDRPKSLKRLLRAFRKGLAYG